MEAERARYKLLKEQSDKAYELKQAQQKAERDAIRAAARKKQEEVAAQRAREQAEAERQVRKIATEMQLFTAQLTPFALPCRLGWRRTSKRRNKKNCGKTGRRGRERRI